MKKTMRTTIISFMLVAMGMSACVTTRPVDQVAAGSSEAMLEVEMNRRLSDFRDLTEQGNCQEAERLMQNMMGEVESSDNALEITMKSDICLCHIEGGEVRRFVDCADELDLYTEGVRILDRETQYVERLSGYFSNDAESDSRIDSDIHTGFVQTLGDNKEE